MSKPQTHQPRFSPLQIALWLAGFIFITGNGTLLFLDLSHWLQNDWLHSLRHLALPIGLLCFWLARSRRLFGQETPLRADVFTLWQLQGAQQAKRMTLLAALAFTIGAWLGKIEPRRQAAVVAKEGDAVRRVLVGPELHLQENQPGER
jgi:hypothetical protein